ncbi:MAG: hypoxanthine phosphoribosyltransferase [Clostridiales bacterium]|jgi:hypoxanthine phosphoribosyltransferase|nr:hypoxanthine phosphoribosyltransferase [Clostridiales bacterium]
MKEIEEYLGRVLVPREEIRKMVADLGARITNDYRGKELFLIGVLKGGFMFLADLVREIRIPVELDFISVSSYGSSTKSSGIVQLIKDVDVPLNEKHVIIVEDIIDTGLTLTYLKDLLSARNPLSVKICTAFDKPSRRKVDLKAEYTGITVPDEYVVGYGLDFNGILRNVPDLYVLDEKFYK